MMQGFPPCQGLPRNPSDDRVWTIILHQKETGPCIPPRLLNVPECVS